MRDISKKELFQKVLQELDRKKTRVEIFENFSRIYPKHKNYLAKKMEGLAELHHRIQWKTLTEF